MRLSTDKNDPGFRDWDIAVRLSKNIIVLLNGVEVKDCEMADEEKGEVIVCKHDAYGYVYIEQGTDAVARETIYGKVEILTELQEVKQVRLAQAIEGYVGLEELKI